MKKFIVGHYKNIFLSFILGLSISIISVSAFAYVYSSKYTKYSNNGYNYNAFSVLGTEGNQASAGTLLESVNNVKVPGGYMGVRARIYASNGTMLTQTDWSYNDTPSAGLQISTRRFSSKKTYYSRGITAAYNGNGYTNYELNRTPNATI